MNPKTESFFPCLMFKRLFLVQLGAERKTYEANLNHYIVALYFCIKEEADSCGTVYSQ